MHKLLLISPFILFIVLSIKLNPITRKFIDDSNRTVIFHGVNIVVKQPPYLPITDHFDPQMSLSAEDIQNLTN